jgi:conjugal transfer pilus assembly protein TraV
MIRQCVIITFGLSLLLLAGCAPVNTQFSCNATASDRCLSIEEVDAMTQSGSTNTPQKRPISHRWNPAEIKADNRPSQPHLASKTQTIWIAPWTDETGQLHQNDTLFASTSRVTTTG